MKNDLTCGVVRDLLPSYVEGLLGEESREAVERHLEGCPDCAAMRDAMSAPAEAAAETVREVDFLKRVKKKNRRRIALSVAATFAGLLAAFLLKIFVIGTPLQGQMVYCDTEEEDGVLHLSIGSVGSGNAFHGWTVEVEDGIASVYARSVLAGLYKDGGGTVEIPLGAGQDVQEVWVGGISGKLVWQDGMVISPQAMVLLDAQTPYCGDPAALGRIAEILDLQDHLGSYTVSMKTSRKPYRWTLTFENDLNPEQRTYMVRAEYLMLALVGNLDEASFTLPEVEDPVTHSTSQSGGSMTLEAAARGVKHLTDEYNRTQFKSRNREYWEVKSSIKDYTRTPADFQRLLEILELL